MARFSTSKIIIPAIVSMKERAASLSKSFLLSFTGSGNKFQDFANTSLLPEEQEMDQTGVMEVGDVLLSQGNTDAEMDLRAV